MWRAVPMALGRSLAGVAVAGLVLAAGGCSKQTVEERARETAEKIQKSMVDVEGIARAGLRMLYRRATVVLSPSFAADASVATLGVEPGSVGTMLARAEAEFERKFRARYGEQV